MLVVERKRGWAEVREICIDAVAVPKFPRGDFRRRRGGLDAQWAYIGRIPGRPLLLPTLDVLALPPPASASFYERTLPRPRRLRLRPSQHHSRPCRRHTRPRQRHTRPHRRHTRPCRRCTRLRHRLHHPATTISGTSRLRFSSHTRVNPDPDLRKSRIIVVHTMCKRIQQQFRTTRYLTTLRTTLLSR